MTRHIRDAENNRAPGSTTVSAKPSNGASLLGDEGIAPVIRTSNGEDMIVQIDGIRCAFPGAPVYDYASIESVDEFRSLVEFANVIHVVDTNGENEGPVYGAAVIDAIAQKVIPSQKLSVVVFAVNCSFLNQHLEHICAATEVVKGLHEWPTTKS